MASEHQVTASIIMINRNGGEYLRRALASCCRALEAAWTSGGRFELIVVDNGSTDDSIEVIEGWERNARFPFKVVKEPTAGVSSARNAGIRHANGTYLIFVDSDLEFSPDWLSAYLKSFVSFPEQRVFGGRVRLGHVDGPIPNWLALDGEYTRPAIVVQVDNGAAARVCSFDDAKTTGPVGGNMACHRSLFEQFGLLDTSFGFRTGSLVPGDEYEFFDRLARGGVDFVYVPDAVVFHPFKRHQISKRYFLDRLHGIGRVAARMRRIREEPCKRLFGVTLYTFEYLIAAASPVRCGMVAKESEGDLLLTRRDFDPIGLSP